MALGATIYALDRALIGELVSRLERRLAFSLSVTDREIYLSIGADNLTGAVTRLRLDDRAIHGR